MLKKYDGSNPLLVGVPYPVVYEKAAEVKYPDFPDNDFDESIVYYDQEDLSLPGNEFSTKFRKFSKKPHKAHNKLHPFRTMDNGVGSRLSPSSYEGDSYKTRNTWPVEKGNGKIPYQSPESKEYKYQLPLEVYRQ